MASNNNNNDCQLDYYNLELKLKPLGERREREEDSRSLPVSSHHGDPNSRIRSFSFINDDDDYYYHHFARDALAAAAAHCRATDALLSN